MNAAERHTLESTLVELADVMQRAGRVLTTLDLSPQDAVNLRGLLTVALTDDGIPAGAVRVAEKMKTDIDKRLKQLGASDQLIAQLR